MAVTIVARYVGGAPAGIRRRAAARRSGEAALVAQWAVSHGAPDVCLGRDIGRERSRCRRRAANFVSADMVDRVAITAPAGSERSPTTGEVRAVWVQVRRHSSLSHTSRPDPARPGPSPILTSWPPRLPRPAPPRSRPLQRPRPGRGHQRSALKWLYCCRSGAEGRTDGMGCAGWPSRAMVTRRTAPQPRRSPTGRPSVWYFIYLYCRRSGPAPGSRLSLACSDSRLKLAPNGKLNPVVTGLEYIKIMNNRTNLRVFICRCNLTVTVSGLWHVAALSNKRKENHNVSCPTNSFNVVKFFSGVSGSSIWLEWASPALSPC